MQEFTAPETISELPEFLRPTPQIRSDERLQDEDLRRVMAQRNTTPTSMSQIMARRKTPVDYDAMAKAWSPEE